MLNIKSLHTMHVFAVIFKFINTINSPIHNDKLITHNLLKILILYYLN